MTQTQPNDTINQNLPVIHAGSPIFTNAHLNRNAAIKCFQAGMSAEQIAAEWPEVWRCVDGKLGQIYDYQLADGSERLETNRRILDKSVTAAIRRHKRAR
jgi:uncharacterized protein (DUF433 family)